MKTENIVGLIIGAIVVGGIGYAIGKKRNTENVDYSQYANAVEIPGLPPVHGNNQGCDIPSMPIPGVHTLKALTPDGYNYVMQLQGWGNVLTKKLKWCCKNR